MLLAPNPRCCYKWDVANIASYSLRDPFDYQPGMMTNLLASKKGSDDNSAVQLLLENPWQVTILPLRTALQRFMTMKIAVGSVGS